MEPIETAVAAVYREMRDAGRLDQVARPAERMSA